MAIQTLSPADALAMTASGARLIDIRSLDEFKRAKAKGAQNKPLDTLSDLAGEQPVIFMCKSGMRTGANAAKLEAACSGQAYVLEGGLDGWKSAGLPVEEDSSQPIEIMRQVQITAGSLVLIGVLLGSLVSPLWFGLSAFIGAGLTFSGVTGSCGMAKMLSIMPWNRRALA